MKTLHSVENIPLELRESPQWVTWKYEVRKGKETKVPYVAGDARRADSTDPATWRPFNLAVIHNGRDGIGYVFSEDDGRGGVDLDDCIVNGEIEPWAREIITTFDSYTEVSPSRDGVKIFCRGTKPGSKCKSGKNHYRPGQIEMYHSERFFTLTGRHVEGTPLTIEDRQAEFEALYWRVFGQESPKSPVVNREPVPLSDLTLIEKARSARNGSEFAQLWEGDISAYPSHSEADLALCNMLAFWTNGDAARMDRLFRQSGLYRDDKWGIREDYRRRTLQKAIDNMTNGYTGTVADVAPETHSVSVAAEARCRLTDTGNAERLVARYGHELRYCYPWRRWLVWDNTRWAEDKSGQVMRRAKATVRAIYGEAAQVVDEDRRKAIAKHAIRSESANRLKAAIELAQSEMSIPVLPEMLDRDPWLFNVQNGTIDLRTGELLPHDPKRLMSKIAPVEYDRNAPCSLWLMFLDRIMDGNRDKIEFLQRAVGYSLTGDTSEQCVIIEWGTGANGKTTYQQAIVGMMGDYAQTTPIGTLTARRVGNAPSSDLARLHGARFVMASEADRGVCFSEGTVKLLTGSDTIATRFLYGEVFEFIPQFKLWIATNHKPVIKGTDNAIWRRIRLVPFTVTIPEDKQDKDLATKLQAELPGILSWAVQGCLDWQEKGLDAPAEVVDATAEYRAEMDVLGQFLDECCVVHPNAKVGKGELYTAFDAWGGDMSKRAFSKAMQERGFTEIRVGEARTRAWDGVGFG